MGRPVVDARPDKVQILSTTTVDRRKRSLSTKTLKTFTAHDAPGYREGDTRTLRCSLPMHFWQLNVAILPYSHELNSPLLWLFGNCTTQNY